MHTFELLSTIEVPVYLLDADRLGVTSENDIQVAIDNFYKHIVSALKCGSSETVP